MKSTGFVSASVGFVAATLLFCVSATSAMAQQGGQVESRLEARKVVVKDGKESFESGAAAKPGDTIEYVATYTLSLIHI